MQQVNVSTGGILPGVLAVSSGIDVSTIAARGLYEFTFHELDEIDIFERILDAFDNQTLEDEKNISTIN